MRITGGEAKGRTFYFPSNSSSRPTSDFLREALFNLLGTIADQKFLDLFAGSGSAGIEALSRKASDVFFVEKDRKLAEVIRKNVASCGYLEKSQIIAMDTQIALRDLYLKNHFFDVIFADPPYNRGLIGETLLHLQRYPVINEDAIIVLQHSVKEKPSVLPEGMILTDQRKYGENILTFVRMDTDGTGQI